MFGLGPFEMVVIGVIAVLLFGGNLPEVARKFGTSYRDLRRGLNDIQQQFREAEYETKKAFKVDPSSRSESRTSEFDDADENDEPTKTSAPKFTPPK